MKRSLSLACILIACTSAVCIGASEDDKESERLVEKEGKFSFVVPKDWEIRKMEGREFKFVFGPKISGITSNMNVSVEKISGTLDGYVRVSQMELKKHVKSIRVIERNEFKTNEGLRCVRLVTESNQLDHDMRQTFFVFGNARRKYVVTCTTGSEDGASLDKVFEKSMKTFRIED